MESTKDLLVLNKNFDISFCSENIEIFLEKEGSFLSFLKAKLKEETNFPVKYTYFEKKEKYSLDIFFNMKEEKYHIIIEKKSDLNYSNIRNFISYFSHELKTPLTIIKGYIETLRDFDLSYEKRKIFFNKILSAQDRLSDLVTKLVKLSLIEKDKKLELKKIDLIKLLQRLKEEFLDFIDIEIFFRKTQKKESFIVLGDEDLLYIAYKNILVNALKHNKKIAYIKIALEEKDKQVSLSFKEYEKKDLKIRNKKTFFKIFKDKNSLIHLGQKEGLSLIEKILQKHMGSLKILRDKENYFEAKVFLKKF